MRLPRGGAFARLTDDACPARRRRRARRRNPRASSSACSLRRGVGGSSVTMALAARRGGGGGDDVYGPGGGRVATLQFVRPTGGARRRMRVDDDADGASDGDDDDDARRKPRFRCAPQPPAARDHRIQAGAAIGTTWRRGWHVPGRGAAAAAFAGPSSDGAPQSHAGVGAAALGGHSPRSSARRRRPSLRARARRSWLRVTSTRLLGGGRASRRGGAPK